ARLATEGVVFEDLYAEALPTIPARKVYFTGRPLFPTWRVQPFKGDPLSTQPGWNPLPEDSVTLPEMAARRGVITGLITDVYHFFKPGQNLHRGWSSWQWIRGQEADRFRAGPRTVLAEARQRVHLTEEDLSRSALPRGAAQYVLNTAGRSGEADYFVAQVMHEAADWLERHAGGALAEPPFLLWVDCFDPHEPWDPPSADADQYGPRAGEHEPIFASSANWSTFTPAEQARILALYRGEVTMVDRWIGHLLATLQRLGRERDTAVLFLADHGTILGEHGRLHKQPELLIAAETHLPFLLRLPKGAHAGQRVSGFLQAFDVTATILDILGVEERDGMRGRSALELLDGRWNGRDAVLSAYRDYVSLRDRRWNCIVHREEGKVVGAPCLFDLTDGEAQDVAAQHPTIVHDYVGHIQLLASETA
ncbi:MAG: sulfatase, partial [Chloroflexi bacterium]|nr:sulfatase [Chloroflexota bacterium]